MATRCRVGVLNEDLSVQSIYVHWDGYPEYTGKVLQECYVDPGVVQNLVEGGYLSIISDASPGERKPHALQGNHFLDRVILHPLDEWPDSGQDYEYCFNPRGGSWAFRKTYGDDKAWRSLSQFLSERETNRGETED
jgi:hypothetical protein